MSFLLAAICSVPASAALAGGHPFRVLHHEILRIESTRGGADETVSFVAYGRQFDLQLSPNERVQRAFSGAGARAVPFQGAVQGAPGSWARLTRGAGGRWYGMFFDGADVYAVEPVEALEGALVQPTAAPAGTPVIFRLADAWLPLGSAQCATLTAGEEATALEAYEAVASSPDTLAAADGSATRRLLVGVVADYEFAQFFDDDAKGTTAEQAIMQRMNVVDGIFSAQLGVKIELAVPTVFRNADDPFHPSNANDLLEELRRYRASSGTEMAHGITHLMTGRDMEGETVGVAYLGSVCGGGAASSLSEGTRSTTSAALIAAHEIGHNFNAPHDGDTNGACASTAQAFLMAPRLNGSQQFSDCSLQQMMALAAHAHCLADIGAPAGEAPPGESAINPPPAAESGGGSADAVLLLAVGLLLLLRTIGAPARHHSGHARDSHSWRRRRHPAIGIHAGGRG